MVAGLVPQVSLDTRLARLEADLDALSLEEYLDQSPAQARQSASRLRMLQSRLATHAGAAVRAVESLVPSRNVSQLLASDFGHDSKAAFGELKKARLVSNSSRAEQAAADGTITVRHAEVVGKALADLPADTTPAQRDLAERVLVRDAERLTLKDLEIRGRRITDQYKAEPEVDRDEDALLRAREARARANTYFRMWDVGDGTSKGEFRIPELQARMLKTMQDAFTAPRRDHLDGETDPFETTQKKAGRAFCQILEHVSVDGLPTTGGTPAQIVITINEDKLRSDFAAATLSTGERISAGELRRLACSHGILPMVLDGASVPVDLGRSQRLANKHQRNALAVLDGGCTAPGCDRPPEWCEADHIREWQHGGETRLEDLHLLCSSHHHERHQNHWQIRRAPDGVVEYDKGSGWERNQRHRT